MVQLDAHGKWAESEYQPWIARTRKTVVKTPTMNNRDFTDDILIFAETSKGMQTLLKWYRISQYGVAWKLKFRTILARY